MQLLPVAAQLDGVHHNIFGSHEGQFLAQMLLDDLGIDHQPVHHVDVQVQDGVHSQEEEMRSERMGLRL